jgi:hypothetical protein
VRILVFVVVLLAACQAVPSPTPVAPTVAPAAVPAGLLQIGEEGQIALSAAEAYPLSESPATYRELDAAARNGDAQAVRNAVSTGRAVAVANHTRVRVLAYDANLIQVAVVDGDQRGKSGWLPLNLVGH